MTKDELTRKWWGMTEPRQDRAPELTAEQEMNRALNALRLEVPPEVADDVSKKVYAALEAAQATIQQYAWYYAKAMHDAYTEAQDAMDTSEYNRGRDDEAEAQKATITDKDQIISDQNEMLRLQEATIERLQERPAQVHFCNDEDVPLLETKVESLQAQLSSLTEERDALKILAEVREREDFEWLCKTCNAVYPATEKFKFFKPCPVCGATLLPSNQNVRALDAALIQVSALTEELTQVRAERDEALKEEAEVRAANGRHYTAWQDALAENERLNNG